MECVRPAAGTEAPSGFTQGRYSSAWGPIRVGCSQSTGPLEGPPLVYRANRYPGHWGGQGRGEAGPAHHLGPSPTPTARPPVSPPPSLLTTITPTAASSGPTVTCSLLSHCLRHTDPASSSLLTTPVPTASGQCPPPRENSHLCTCLDTAPAVPTSASGSWSLRGLLRSGPGPCPSQEPLAENNSSGDCLGRGQLGQEPPRLATPLSNPPTSQARVQERRDVQKCSPGF